MNSKDPKGYYAILGLSIDATAAEIKEAYRRKAMELHPDRNKSPNATKEFQLLNEGYNILSDPRARAEYDTITVDTNSRESELTEEPPEPIICSSCSKVTAQPRYAIFYEVKSFIFMTTRTPIQGIFCSSCAEKKALRASAISWLLGWWGFPWGLLYTPCALAINLVGGQRPHNINARIVGYQAWYFAVQGRFDIARAVARDALEIARKIGLENDEGKRLRKQLKRFLSSLGPDDKAKRLKNSWSLFRRPFFAQILMGGLVVAIVWGIGASQPPSKTRYKPQAPKPFTSSQITPAPVKKPIFIRPLAAPNGAEWPIQADYIPGYARLHTKGHSKLTVDNSQNDSDVFVKLVFLDSSSPYTVRTFYIPGHGSFTVNKINAGTYDVRYQNLASGRLSRSQEFDLEENHTTNGIEFTDMRMTLYKVPHGNMKTFDCSDDEFSF